MSDIPEYSVSIRYKSKGVAEVNQDAEKVKKGIDGVKKTSQGMTALKTGLGIVGNALKTTVVAGVAGLVKLGKTATKYSKETSDYIETLNLFRTSMGRLAQQAEEFRDRAQLELGLDPSSVMNAIASFQNLSEGFGIASDRAYIMSKNLTQLAGDLSSFANISYDTAQQKLMSGFSGQVMPLRQYGIALDQASLQELAYSLGIDKRVKSMTRAQKTELIYYQIMKSTQKMQGDLGRTLMSPANSLRVLKTEFIELGRAVGKIFIPIIQRIIPLMRAVTKALTSAAESVAYFFGFRINDFTVSLEDTDTAFAGVTDDIDDMGDSAEDTAKKLNKMLMPFDELNNLTTSNNSGGSGVGDIGAGGSLGIELPEYDMFANIDDRIYKFENILEKVKGIAEKINELLREIPWDKVKEGAGNLGKAIAEFQNTIWGTIDFELLGRSFAEGLNSIIELAYNYVTTFNWKQYGQSIGNAINGLFLNINWEKAAQTINIGIKGLLDTIITFLKTVNWEDIGRKIGEFLGTLDYIGIASKILELIAVAIGKIDKLFEGFATGIIKSIYKSMTGMEVSDAEATGMAKAIKSIVEDAILLALPGGPFLVLIKEIGVGLMRTFWKGVEENTNPNLPIGERIAQQFELIWLDIKIGIASGAKATWDFLTNILEGIVNFFIDAIDEIIMVYDRVAEFLGWDEIDTIDAFEAPRAYADEIDDAIAGFEERKREITQGPAEVRNSMTRMVEAASSGFKKIINDKGFSQIEEKFDSVWRTAESKVNTSSKNIYTITADTLEKTAQTQGFAKIRNKFDVTYGDAEEIVFQDTNDIYNTTESNLNKVANSGAFAKIKNIFNTTYENAKNKVVQSSNEMQNATESNLNKIVNSGAFAKIRNIFDTTYQNAKNKVTQESNEMRATTESNLEKIVNSGAFGKIRNIFDTTYQNAKNTVEQKTNEIKNTTESNLDKINQSSVFSKIRNTIQSALDNGQAANSLGSNTARNYESGLQSSFQGNSLSNYVYNKIYNAFNLKGSAYNWGYDMMSGLKSGIDAGKQLAVLAAQGVAQGISAYLHFSRPDEGPLREYESWMPDMIKGLSKSLLNAIPLMDSAVDTFSGKIANSLQNIVTPDVNNSIYATNNNDSIVKAINNKNLGSQGDDAVLNMMKATYSGFSRALLENNTDTKQPMQIFIGNREVYRGYAQYKDEENNMLGMNT